MVRLSTGSRLSEMAKTPLINTPPVSGPGKPIITGGVEGDIGMIDPNKPSHSIPKRHIGGGPTTKEKLARMMQK